MAGTRKFNEDTLLEQAIQIFWSKGYNTTTMLDLANETGIQRGSLYNAYQNKNTLFIKSFEHYIQSFLKQIEADLQQQDVSDAFEKLFKNMVARLTGDKDNKGCFSTRTMMEAADECPEILSLLKKLLDGMEKIFTQRLQQALKDKQFTGDAKRSARYLVAITRGIAVIERVYGDKKRLTEIYKTALDNMPFTQ